MEAVGVAADKSDPAAKWSAVLEKRLGSSTNPDRALASRQRQRQRQGEDDPSRALWPCGARPRPETITRKRRPLITMRLDGTWRVPRTRPTPRPPHQAACERHEGMHPSMACRYSLSFAAWASALALTRYGSKSSLKAPVMA